MGLPTPGQPWPPTSLAAQQAAWETWQAWWEGNTADLRRIYTGASHYPTNRPSQYRGGLVGMAARAFWGRPLPAGEPASEALHIPAAADLAQVSAEQVYSEPPQLSIAGLGEGETDPAQELLDAIQADGLWRTLIEGAEAGAVFGGRYHAVTLDPSVNDGRPFLTTIDPANAYPEFRWGHLVAVTFVWDLDGGDEYRRLRHLERHELNARGEGIILHGLYEGTREDLGRPVPLTEHPATAPLADRLTADGQEIGLPLTPGLWCAYVPNLVPQRAWRKHDTARYFGRSDFDGVEGLFDQLDKTWSALCGEVDLAKGRIIVDEALLSMPDGLGGGAEFSMDRRVFTPLPGGLGNDGGPGIREVQFALRAEEYLRVCTALQDEIITRAGWSKATFGEHAGDTDITATEVKAREKRTQTKRGRRIGQETPALAHLGRKLLDAAGMHGRSVQVEFPDAVSPSPDELARTASLLRAARAASDYTVVQMVHPEWSDAQIMEEVERITRQGAQLIDSDRAGWQP